MSSAPAEIEACLAFVGAERPELFEALAVTRDFAGLRVGPATCSELRDAYFDTPGHDLARADMALRWRRRARGGDLEQLLTWKGPASQVGASGVTRAELEGPASSELLQALLEQARQSGAALAFVPRSDGEDPERWLTEAGLVCVQERETSRTSAPLFDAAGNERCELALDLVRYHAGDVSVSHRELELEARGGTGFAEVEALAAQLVAAHPGELRSWPWSKTALGAALEALASSGELGALVDGDELTPRGYELVAARLGA